MSHEIEAVATPTAVGTLERDALRIMVCPLCHTPEPTMNQAAVEAGGSWTCRRCSQAWDGPRLATVAAYATRVADHHRS